MLNLFVKKFKSFHLSPTDLHYNSLIQVILFFYIFYSFQTRMQALQPDPRARYKGVVDGLSQILRGEGIWNTIRGINAVVGGAGPAHALYFSCYEHIKRKMMMCGGNQQMANGNLNLTVTNLISFTKMYFASVIKLCMSTCYNLVYKNLLNC